MILFLASPWNTNHTDTHGVPYGDYDGVVPAPTDYRACQSWRLRQVNPDDPVTNFGVIALNTNVWRMNAGCPVEVELPVVGWAGHDPAIDFPGREVPGSVRAGVVDHEYLAGIAKKENRKLPTVVLNEYTPAVTAALNGNHFDEWHGSGGSPGLGHLVCEDDSAFGPGSKRPGFRDRVGVGVKSRFRDRSKKRTGRRSRC